MARAGGLETVSLAREARVLEAFTCALARVSRDSSFLATHVPRLAHGPHIVSFLASHRCIGARGVKVNRDTRRVSERSAGEWAIDKC